MTKGQMTLKILSKVKSKVTKIKPTYDFLLMINSNNVPSMRRFEVIYTLKITTSNDLENIVQGQIQGHKNKAHI